MNYKPNTPRVDASGQLTKRDEINEVTVPLDLGKKRYRFAIETN